MRKIISALLLCIAWSATAQNENQNVRPVTASQTIQTDNYHIQVGVPMLGTTIGQAERTTEPLDVRFPWDILYLPTTFSESSFDVSKGYFGDMIRISWVIQSNFDLISNIAVFRREFTEDNSNEFVQIANTAPIATEYEDEFVEGGILYEYKIEAQGIGNISGRLLTFIDGIGYRSPTAIVTGSVNFEGGNPVQDVVIRATSQSASTNEGTGLAIPSTGNLLITTPANNAINTAATLQAFLKPQSPLTTASAPIRLFSLMSNNPGEPVGIPINTEVSFNPTLDELTVSIDGKNYIITGFYPSGELLPDGTDELIPVSSFNSSFIHISVQLSDGQTPVLFINGRRLNTAYQDANNVAYPGFEILEPTGTTTFLSNGTEISWNTIAVGGENDGLVDEIRIWKNIIEDEDIRTDYRRFVNGNNANLISYIRANEGVGGFAYDLSRTGFDYNNNHGHLFDKTTPEADKVVWVGGEGNVPTQQQLGVLGVTDENGNYEITAIPYSGTGESFNITPLLGVHEFAPNQQLVFLGQGAEVVNSINFTDISSFSFKGRVLYDSRNVFNPIAGAEIFSSDIDEVGYNQFQIGPNRFQKGEYWLNDNGTPDDLTDNFLENYATIFSEGVNVFIDGEIVLDENNTPVVTDAEGFFDISVPIGNHYITVGSADHIFEFSGRFPAEPGTFEEFFEDRNNVTTFIDNTKVTLTGRVVGGSVESVRPLGFGQDGFVEYEYTDTSDIQQTFPLSSKNNIGVANLTLGYMPPSGMVTNDTRVNYSTNDTSGEYRITLLPLNYSLESVNVNLKTGEDTSGNDIVTNVNLIDPQQPEDVNLKTIPEVVVPLVELPDGNIEQGAPYHLAKNTIYRAIPILRVIGQTSEELLQIRIGVDENGEDILEEVSAEGFQFPVYRQFSNYLIDLNRFEEYVNYDDLTMPVFSQDPIVDGELLITNNLALDNSELIEVDANDASLIHYSFRGGLPRISAPYTRTIDINYRIQGIDYPAENVQTEGVILGGAGDGSQTFFTVAPDIPDIILRDPPGSNSSATIESGQSISIIKETSLANSNALAASVNLSVGGTVTIGGGVAGPVIETSAINEVTTGIGLSTSSENSESIQKTYTFSQSISTSSETDFVGSQGDLYIGSSANYAYGSYDDVFASVTEVPEITDFQLTNSEGQTIHIGRQKSIYSSEEPTGTFYVLSQKTILEVTIPELQLFIQGIENGSLTPGVDGIQSQAFYEQQILLWRRTILENERSKFISLNNPTGYRTDMLNDIQNESNIIEEAIFEAQGRLDELIESLPSNPAADSVQFLIRQVTDRIAILQLKKSDLTDLLALINENFSENISFDSGVGDFTRSIETTIAVARSSSFTIETEAAFEAQLGGEINDIGVTATFEGKYSEGLSTTLGLESEDSTTISYSLNDSDPDNLLSLDVVNLYNGNGPVFSTVGGRTSCPYEDAEKAIFYNPATYDPDATTIEPLDPSTEVLLSVATQRVEVPVISVEVASVTNIPESQNAEFVLLLENNSATESDADFVLRVDNTTNPNNAIINIEPNGTIVTVPFGEQIPFALTLTKSISDVFVYEDIRIVLQSFCDGEEVSDDVLISATFVPACSSVAVTAPSENWVFNREAAFNIDDSSNPMQIDISGYNLAFDSFEKIDLEYRLATAPSWNRLQSYYTTQEFFDNAQLNGETDISLINGSNLLFPFDIVGAAIQDGTYEIRARSSCVNGTEFISEAIPGTIDLTAPRRFNTPSPQDGILSSGDDILASFNEDIFFNSAISQITITGRTNQLPINNSVSVRFAGGNDEAIIVDPDIVNGDFSLEFWMLNETTAGSATLFSQDQGLSIVLNDTDISFTLGGTTVNGNVPADGLFHHYTFTYDEELGRMSAYRDDMELEILNGLENLQFTNNNDLIIGSSDFIGNIHDLRMWTKPLLFEDAFANLFTDFIGNERNLIGYWPMDEGRGPIARDDARFNNLIVNAGWDIRPNGESYQFEANQFQTLDNVNFVQLDDETDATISFWMKTATAQEATIFSNGRGDGTDLVQANGLQNKWAINLGADGNLSFASEGTSYPLTTETVVDDDWHHLAILLNRNGSLITYVDGVQVSSNPTPDIGGFSGNLIWLGARGQTDNTGAITIDREYSGQLDEFRLWNTLRNVDQISRDQYMEVDPFVIGMLLYARMNEPDPVTGDGPIYFHAFVNGDIITSEAVLNNGIVNYNTDVPPIKPEREIVSFQVNRVINGDEIILEPVITDPAAIEGQILDITVNRLFDAANNRQESPITWTAFVQRNDVSWFASGFNEVVDLIKQEEEDVSFDITIVNQGGTNQPYSIENIPSWLSIENANGVLAPNSDITLSAAVSNDITAGNYIEDIFLETDFGFDQRIQIDLQVLADAPDWDVNPQDYEFSMNVIGRITVDGSISRDPFDRIGAFVDGEPRGFANLVYDENFDEYFSFQTIYSNVNFGEEVSYRIWDASQGSVLNATVDGASSNTFSENDVIGSLVNPTLFENNGEFFQELFFNSGWTWVSMNVNDVDFQDINQLTAGMDLESSDRITSVAPGESFVELYYEDLANPDNSGWNGSISSNGGISSTKMYRFFIANEQSLIIEGQAVDIETFVFNVEQGWNWFPYPYNSNHSVNEALALLEPSDGDVIKSQTKFAIYDSLNGWSGTLTTLEGGNGYLLLSGTDQVFSYPTYLNRSSSTDFSKSNEESAISNYASFANNMNAVVKLPEGYTTVFVYDDLSNIKGHGKVQSQLNGENIAYVTIYGESTQNLTFYVANDSKKVVTQQEFNFKVNNVLGTTKDPIPLTLFETNVNVYPNPFKNEINIDFSFDKEQTINIQIFNSINQLVYSESLDVIEGNNSHKLETRLSKGLYFMHINTEGNTWIEKIIKQ